MAAAFLGVNGFMFNFPSGFSSVPRRWLDEERWKVFSTNDCSVSKIVNTRPKHALPRCGSPVASQRVSRNWITSTLSGRTLSQKDVHESYTAGFIPLLPRSSCLRSRSSSRTSHGRKDSQTQRSSHLEQSSSSSRGYLLLLLLHVRRCVAFFLPLRYETVVDYWTKVWLFL